MSVLHFLPRLTSWGNLYSKGERTQDFSQNDSDDLLSLRNKIGNQRQIVPPLSKGRHRRKISYWSDNEEDKKYRRDLQRSFILLEIPLLNKCDFSESQISMSWKVCSAESSWVKGVQRPKRVMIQQNTPTNELIEAIQEKSHEFTVGFPFNTRVKTLNH